LLGFIPKDKKQGIHACGNKSYRRMILSTLKGGDGSFADNTGALTLPMMPAINFMSANIIFQRSR
jgi:hypothetical protein